MIIRSKPRRTKFPANYVGPQIRRLRAAQGWSQSKLAERLQLSGLSIGREVVAQIEARRHCIKDSDLIFFAYVFQVDLSGLYSGNKSGQRAIMEALARLQASSQTKSVNQSCNEFITTASKHKW